MCGSRKAATNKLKTNNKRQRLNFVSKSIKNWCWSRQDNSDDVLKNLTIFSGSYDNSDFNDKINRPFTAKFYDNGTHMICFENKRLSTPIPVDGDERVVCPTSTGIPLAMFIFSQISRQIKL